MGTKNNPGSFDCYAAALPDEPLFHLLGRDPAFPATVRFWMGERARLGKNVESDDINKVGEAALVAQQAETWRGKIIEALGEDGELPWRSRPHVDSYDRDPPVRADGAWSGDQGGPVSVLTIKGWDEWAVAGSIAIARRNFGQSGVPALADFAKLLAETERSGWHVEQIVGYRHGYEVVFRKVDYVFSATEPLLPIFADDTTAQAIQDNLHLRAKMVVGLNQVANDLAAFVNGKVDDPENHATAKGLLEFVDRINGHAAELGDGVPVDMIHLPSEDPARGADTSHATVAEVPEAALDFGDPIPEDTALLVQVRSNFGKVHEATAIYTGGAWAFVTAMGANRLVIRTEPMRGAPLAWKLHINDEWNTLDEPLELTEDMRVPCNPADEDCTGMGRGLQP